MADINRRLATLETITDIRPIEGADAINRARVRGWDIVVKIGEFTPGAACVYFEVDTLLDTDDERFAWLAPRGVRTDADGNSGHVLKTARLRGVYSQGLALTLDQFPELAGLSVGDDVTDLLPVRKWEPAIPANLAGLVRGRLPSWIPATDEERIQNIPQILAAAGHDWVATEKVDGTSTTVWVTSGSAGDDFGVCSRNLDLLESDTNTLWSIARRLDLHAKLRDSHLGERVALQGETFGDGIQKNPLRVKGHHFAAFTLRVDGVEVPRGSWPQWLLDISVPVHPLRFPASLDEALAQVESLKSLITPQRAAEGVVWRARGTQSVVAGGEVLRASFKAISNRYLLKNDR